MGYFIKRPANMGLLNWRPRYLTRGGGWTTNLRNAKNFPTRREANNKNRTRDIVVKIRCCRRCNCTQTAACITKVGGCAWVEHDLCDACLTPAECKRWIAGFPKPSGGKD
jgi:hypothetical protein